jgi:hypothetical protein
VAFSTSGSSGAGVGVAVGINKKGIVETVSIKGAGVGVFVAAFDGRLQAGITNMRINERIPKIDFRIDIS